MAMMEPGEVLQLTRLCEVQFSSPEKEHQALQGLEMLRELIVPNRLAELETVVEHDTIRSLTVTAKDKGLRSADAERSPSG